MKVQDLTLVGLTEDKKNLVLVSDTGEEFSLPADARLRAALRGDHARLGQLEITMDSALRSSSASALCMFYFCYSHHASFPSSNAIAIATASRRVASPLVQRTRVFLAATYSCSANNNLTQKIKD